jgi:hypothetical protein
MTNTQKPGKPSGLKRLSAIVTLIALWGMVGAIAAYGIQQLDAHLGASKASTPPPVTKDLAEALKHAGHKITVPAGHGFWPSQTTEAETLIWRAVPSGLPREINLCQQLKNFPDELYPITLAGSWKDIDQGKKAHRPALARAPIAVSPELAQHMPRLTIRGRYRGELVAEVQAASKDGDWLLLFAEQDKNKFRLGKETWLLWRAEKEDSHQPYTHAIRIRRQIDAPQAEPRHCANAATEQLEWQLFIADKRVIPANGMAEVVILNKGAAKPAHLRLPPGEHRAPSLQPMDIEDKALFNRAYAQGLIHQQGDAHLAIAPVDLPRAGTSAGSWERVDLADANVRQTFKALHHSPNGDFVRDRIDEFNSSRQWLAVRVKLEKPEDDIGNLSHWDAQTASQKLLLTNQMPDVTARLFDSIPTGWSPWIRVAGWPASAQEGNAGSPVTVSLTLPQGVARRRLELLVLGRLQQVDGARLISRTAACPTRACTSPEMLTRIILEPISPRISLTVQPEPDFNQLNPDSAASQRLQLKQGRVMWVQAQTAAEPTSIPAAVTLSTRDGIPLFDDGKPLAAAHRLGIDGLVGVSKSHPGSIAGMLARLGQLGIVNVHAQLSLSSRWQQISHQILACEGYRQGKWQAPSGQCQLPEGGTNIAQRRIASLVLMDASNGDILAAAGAPGLPDGVAPDDAIAFDRFNPSVSPLRVHAWQHDQGRRFAPGSTFKLIGALGLESWAAGNAERQVELEGLSIEQWNQRGASLGFSMLAGAYPQKSHLSIANFESKPASAATRNGRFGLAEALEKSTNSWFAWMAERTDQTAASAPDSLPLGHGALGEARPIIAMAQRLGFEQSQRLDGSLFPEQFPWHRDDILATSASTFDPIVDAHQIRSLAIGQRMAVTSLQMARMTAAIATGKIATPRLLLSLNGQQAEATSGVPLGVELRRIRQGMKDVVESGTAAGAFAGPEWNGVRPLIFGKTGSAEMGEPGSEGVCAADRRGQSRKLKVAWFVGYVNAGLIPGYDRPLAFATAISHDCETGGAHAAKIIASLLHTLRQSVSTFQTGTQS